MQYADDCTFFANTREGLARMVMAFKKTVKDVTGMSMHDAATAFPRQGGKSKTVCMVCPPPGVRYKDMDTSPLKLQEKDEETATYVHFEESVVYLGIILHYDLGPDAAMNNRITRAKYRNWEFRRVLRNRAFNAKVKGCVLKAIVLPTLLYGSEAWNPTVVQMKKVTKTWNYCCRAALNITTSIQHDHHIHNTDIFERLGVESVHYYIRHRRLCWLGKIARMGMHRWPRKLLTSQAKVCSSDETAQNTPQTPAEPTGSAEPEDKSEGEAPGAKGQAPIPPNKNKKRKRAYKLPDFLVGVVTVEKAPTRKSGIKAKCKVTDTVIGPGEIRFKCKGKGNKVGYISTVGMGTLLTTNPALVRELDRSLPGIADLTQEEGEAVKSVISPEGVANNIRRIQQQWTIQPVLEMPWTCSRCTKRYSETKRKDAERHAKKGKCTRPVPKTAPTQQAAPKVAYGKERKQTWVSDLRKDLTSDVGLTAPEKGCKQCQIRRSRCRHSGGNTCCDRCLILNMIVVARTKGWDSIVYKTPDEGKGKYGEEKEVSKTTQRRRDKQREPVGVWNDPRPGERLRAAVRTLKGKRLRHTKT